MRAPVRWTNIGQRQSLNNLIRTRHQRRRDRKAEGLALSRSLRRSHPPTARRHQVESLGHNLPAGRWLSPVDPRHAPSFVRSPSPRLGCKTRQIVSHARGRSSTVAFNAMLSRAARSRTRVGEAPMGPNGDPRPMLVADWCDHGKRSRSWTHSALSPSSTSAPRNH